jgi:DNA-binding transcriptional MerR regulator/methylmalonyl-CoA mutase cobalamin-binding subunit
MKSATYPIRAVSKQTGLSIDTLRAWERRYRAVVPQRTKRGRVYTEADIHRLELLRRCTELGYSIGQIAKWENRLLEDVISKQEEKPTIENPNELIDRMLHSLKTYNAAELDAELSRIAILYPTTQLVHEVILPFMNAVGKHWKSGDLRIAQEHLASASLRNLLGTLIRYYSRADSNPTLLFATPKGELHEFGILAAAILAISGGLDILYLGANLPADEILNATKQTSPKAVILGWKAAEKAEQSLLEIKKVSKEIPKRAELWVGGVEENHLQEQLKKTGATFIPDFKKLEEHFIRFGWRG